MSKSTKPEFVQYQDRVLLADTPTTRRFRISGKEGQIVTRLAFGNKIRLLEVLVGEIRFEIQVEDIKKILE